MSPYHGHPRSQNVAPGRLEPPPQISSQRPCPPHPQQGFGFSQPSAPFPQQTLSPSSSYHSTTTYQLGHPVPHQGNSAGVNTTSSRGVGGSVLGEYLPNHNDGNPGWSSMDGLSRQNIQGSSINPTNAVYGYPQAPQHRNEQSIMYQSNASGGLDSWNNFLGLDQFGVTGENSGPDAGGNLDPQPRFPTTLENNFGPGSYLPLTGNQANTSPDPSRGIDPSLMNEYYYEDCANFGADVDQTDGGRGDTQDEGVPRNSENLDSHSPIGSSTSMVSRSDTVSETISRVASGTAPRSRGRARTHARGRARNRARSGAGHRTGQPVSSESSVTTCPTCDNDPDCERRPAYRGSADSQRSSIRRHIREEHSDGQIWSYQCSLNNDGSSCGALISRADNRRRHVEEVHPTESEELPPRDAATRNFNDMTNARLNEWFSKVPR